MSTISPCLLVKENVPGMMYVDIQNQTLEYQSFDYIIYDNAQKIVRKGYFRAPSVQLRTSHLEEGTYKFDLLFNGQVLESTEFRKRTNEFAFA